MHKDNDDQDLVTVVTVTYNAEEFLEETILSVINQNYENVEYMIIDGASSDKTIDIIKKYEKKIDYWMSEPDEGIYYAMNKAIEKATGKWINFMNAGDTFFDSRTISDVMKYKNKDSELIYGNFKVKESGITFKARDKSLWYQQMPFCHQTLFTKSDLMKKVKFDTGFRLAADHNFIIKMYNEERKFFHIDQTLAIFSMGGFAQSNELLMDVESIKVFLDNKVPESEIVKSYWYLDLEKKLSKKYIVDIEAYKDKLLEKENVIKEFNDIRLAIRDVMMYSVLKHPFKKYIGYKKLLSLYVKLTERLRK